MEIKGIEATEVASKRGGDKFDEPTWIETATGLPFVKCDWTPTGLIYVTPCCHAAASINDGPMYCKACYHDVDDRCGAWPGYEGATSYRVSLT